MYEIDLLDEVLSIDLCHGVAKISEVKVGGQINILDLLGSRLCFLVNRCSPGSPGSNPGHCKL